MVSSPLEAGAADAVNFAVVNVPDSDALTSGYFRFTGTPGVAATGTSAGFTVTLSHPGFTGFTIEYAPKTGSIVAATPQQLTTTGAATATLGRLVISEGPLVCATGAGDVRIDDVAFGGAGGALSRLAMTWNLQCNSIPSAPITSGIITFGQQTGPIGSPAVSEFYPISPVRLLDTREGTNTPLGPKGTRNITVAGANGVPGSATAVVVNVTGISPTAPTFLTVFPAGSGLPLASNVNPAVDDIVPNLATVKVGAGGQITLYNEAGNTHAAVDIMGYFAPDNGADVTGGRFFGQTPQRLIDTRDEPRNSGNRVPIGPGGSIDITVDATATAAVLNVTAAESSAASFLTVYPFGEARPGVSNLNFAAAQNIPNLVVVKLNGGKASIFNSAGNAHVVVDVVGLFKEVGAGVTAGRFLPIDPIRAYDSRDPKPQGTELTVIVGANETRDTNIVGLMNKYPFEFSGYIANTTVTATAAPGYLTSFPAGVRPDSSTLNWLAGETRPNLVMMGTDAYGFTSHSNVSSGSTHLFLDVAGWFTR
ncbi:MAG: hypothetical protein ACKV2O_14110 [Acidimicrobiales bacterium]